MATAGDQYEHVTGNIWNYANRGDLTGVQAALAKGVDINLANKTGWTPLHAAAAGGQVGMLRFLLSCGADANLRDNGGRTAVHEAARHGHLQAVQLLVRKGADARAVTNQTQTALELARGHPVRNYLQGILRSEGGITGGSFLAASQASGWSGQRKKDLLKIKRAARRQRQLVENWEATEKQQQQVEGNVRLQ